MKTKIALVLIGLMTVSMAFAAAFGLTACAP